MGVVAGRGKNSDRMVVMVMRGTRMVPSMGGGGGDG